MCSGRTDVDETPSTDRPSASAHAEWDPLQAVRVHLPGIETFVGTLDPEPNLFLEEFSLVEAQHEHLRLVDALEAGLDADDPVHYLHDDLAASDGLMEGLLSSRVRFDLDELDEDDRVEQRDALWSRLHRLDPHTQLQAIASNAEVVRHRGERGEQDPVGSNPNRWDTTSVRLTQPLTNLYFQRDTQFVTQKGVVLCHMTEPTRKPEVDIARTAWEALDGLYDVDIVADTSRMENHDVSEHVPERDDIQSTSVTVEGGDFLPAGEFSLLGVSAKIREGAAYPAYDVDEDDTELVHRTTYAAGHRLLLEDAFGAPEVGLVRAPFEAARDRGTETELDMDIMHLDTWFNFVDDDLAVAHRELLDGTQVDIYRATGDEREPYVLDRPDVNFGEYIRDQGFEVVDTVELVDPGHENAAAALKAITNFLTLGPRKILPVRFDADEEGVMARFVETMRTEYDVEIVPEGEGCTIENLRAGYGAVHCMTTPIRRTPE